MREQTQCPACGDTKHESLREMTLRDVYDVPEKTLSKTNNYQRNYLLFRKILEPGTRVLTVSFRLCGKCDLIFFSPRPDEADLLVKYKEVAATKETERREKAFELIDLRARRAFEIARRLQPFIARPVARALDVGGADGHCLAEFAGTAECAVVDFEERPMWPGVKRIGRTVDDLEPSDRFDLLLCNHTLEHVDDVNRFVGKLKRRLNVGGLLYIEVPMGCNGEIFRTGNVLTHLNFFSRESLSFLLQKNGFSVQQCEEGAVLSKKRYHEVVTAIARKPTGEKSGEATTDHPREGNQLRINRRNIQYQVVFSNILLVLSRPASYASAFWRTYRQNVR